MRGLFIKRAQFLRYCGNFCYHRNMNEVHDIVYRGKAFSGFTFAVEHDYFPLEYIIFNQVV